MVCILFFAPCDRLSPRREIAEMHLNIAKQVLQVA
jgi:hypothetical protein